MTINAEQVQDLTGDVYTSGSDKVGGVGQIYLDDHSGEPSWVTVKTGLFGTSESFVPLQGARLDGNDVHVEFDKDTMKDAPRVDDDGSITPEEEERLYEYYGLSNGTEVRDTDRRDTDTDRRETDTARRGMDTDARRESDARDAGTAGTVGHDTSGPTGDAAMTRSQERMDVGTATREAGRARLRKYVTSETVTETVPVSHEEVTLERESITESAHDSSQAEPEISEEEHEVVLHEEVPVVDKETVAVERVQLGKETVTEDATVSEELKEEQVELVDRDSSDPARTS